MRYTRASFCPSISTQVQVLHWFFKAHYASQVGGKQTLVHRRNVTQPP